MIYTVVELVTGTSNPYIISSIILGMFIANIVYTYVTNDDPVLTKES